MGKTNEKQESIRQKLLSRTVTPTVIGLLITGVLVFIISGMQIKDLENQVIKDSSLNAAYQISEYFTKYMEVSRQLGSDEELVRLFEEVGQGSSIADAA